MKIILIIAFIMMCAVQWFVPVHMIVETESTLSAGKPYKFKTAPIDPTDPLRGSYITLNFQQNTVTVNRNENLKEGDKVFVLLSTDNDGFAALSGATKVQPDDETDYFEAELENVFQDGRVSVAFPFERFYLEESKAPKAEHVYRENTANELCYAVVYVKDGKSVLKDVMIGDRSIVDIVREK